MAATLPYYNSLMIRFGLTQWNSIISLNVLTKFYNAYYSDSDLDICCNADSTIEFIESTLQFVTDLKKHPLLDDDIDITPVKSLIIYVDPDILKLKCESGQIPFGYDYILKELSSNKIKIYFYNMYQSEKLKLAHKYSDIIGNRIEIPEYFEILKLCDINNTKIFLHKTKTKIESDDIILEYYIMDDINKSNVFVAFRENLKFKIESSKIKRTIEYFHINGSFFNSIAKFHLPCVRSYYTGDNCYMLPSAITAYMTFINIDFLYFTGKYNPLEIINKYRQRGYGVILNTQEREYYKKYMQDSIVECAKYNIDINNINNYMDFMPYNHIFYKNNYDILERMPNFAQFAQHDFLSKQKMKYPHFPDITKTQTTINTLGKVTSPKLWIMDAAYY